MSVASIEFSPNILRRLGEELNPNIDQSILELVKNAYDADARNCVVELSSVESEGGSILVTDDGDGMDDAAIANGWLVLGKSDKERIRNTRLHRKPAGSKGLGRLAALRMGQTATLTSRPRTNPGSQYTLEIDWARYETTAVVGDVELTISRARAVRGSKSGTEILIGNLRSPLTRADIRRLARSLILLADPFDDDPESFKATLVAPEFTEFETLVKRRYFDDADYHLFASLDEHGKAGASVVDWKGNELFRADHADLAAKREGKLYAAPPADFDLWTFNLSKTTFSPSSGNAQGIREWLGSFGGVHLYENKLRVSPYGNPGNDWLDMNLRRARSPEEKPSTNNSIGRVRVTDDRSLLIQKTDRSGFIETNEFLELRQFAMDALDWMGRRRLEVAEKRRAKKRAKAPGRVKRAKASVEKAIEKAPVSVRGILDDAFRRYSTEQERAVKQLRREIQLYRTLSTAGITAATFAHESAGNPLKVLAYNVSTVQRRALKWFDRDLYDHYLEEPIDLILKSVESLKVLGRVALSLVDNEKRRLTKVRLHKTIEDVVKLFQPFLDDRKVCLVPEFGAGDPYFRGTEAAVESIVTNVLNNSLVWFEEAHVKQRRIVVRTHVQSDKVILRILDNGPGLKGISKRDIWLPGETRRQNGTGLGLTIVRDAVNDLGGSVDAVEQGELGGAEIIIELPILGA